MIADHAAKVLDLELRTLQPDPPPDDGNLTESNWQVTDEASAEWSLRKVRDARQTCQRATQTARELIAEHERALASLRGYVADQERRAQRTADHFTSLLVDWHRRVLAEDPSRKSIPLSAGLLKSQQTRGKVLSVADAEKLPEGLRRQKWEPDKKAITAWIKETGEIPEGVSWEKPYRKFEVDY